MKLLLVFNLVSTFALAAVYKSGQFSTPVQKYIVAVHNQYRSSKLPGNYPAADMLEIKWNRDLARKAQNWAKKCKFAHFTENYGQNLYQVSGYGHTTHVNKAEVNRFMNNWGQREKAIDFPKAIREYQQSGKLRGPLRHYSQIIWSSTSQVGCAYAICDRSNDPNDLDRFGKRKKKKIVVCNYSSAGNIRGRAWYKVGRSCSACPTGTRCHKRLCKKV